MLINLSKKIGLLKLENFIFFSYQLLFFLINCLIGKASKNSFAINILGIFDKSSKLFNQFIL